MIISKFSLRLSYKALLFCGIFGIILFVAGGYVGFVVIPGIISNQIWETKILKENTEQWNMFMEMPFPFKFKVHIFDVQNPEDILLGAKAIVKDRGPYVYKVYKWKNEIEHSNFKDDISYYGYMRFEFDKESSGQNSDEDTVTVVNAAYNGLLLTVESTQPAVLPMVGEALFDVFGENDGLFIKVKVKDFLFDGIKMCENMGASGGFASKLICKQIKAKLPEKKNMRLDNATNTILFSNLHFKNNTHLGRFTIKSGLGKNEETALLTHYNNEVYSKVWSGENSTCDKIRGITTVFPVNLDKKMEFESYSEDICRVMALKYMNDETVKDILGYRFEAKNDSFSSTKAENQCFCTNQTRTLDGGYGCLKDGLMDLSTCTGGPVLLSFPHLLYADPEYLNSVKGLKPNVSKHGTFVTLEPVSGYPLELAQRVQFNMFIRPIQNITILENITNAVLPMFWVEESTILGDKYTEKLKNTLLSSLQIVDIVKWAVVVTGAAIGTISFFLFVYKRAP